MRSVKIKTNELLNVLRKNRDIHEKEFNESLAGYREAVIKEIKAALKKANNHEDVEDYIQADKPTSYVKSYDTVIRMLEMSSDDIVELTMQEFNQYVQDEWHWKDSFTTTSMKYRN